MVRAMALVQVARFSEVTEAQVAASALRASGIFCLLQNENICQVDFLLQQAVGGFGIWVSEADADDVTIYFALIRDQAPKLKIEWSKLGVLQVALSVGLSLFSGMPVPIKFRRMVYADRGDDD